MKRWQATVGMIAALVLTNARATSADSATPIKSVPLSETAAKGQKEVDNPTVVMLEDATITISSGAKISVRPVKTEQGKRIRLEMPGVTIEAVRLCVKSQGQITELRIGEGDAFDVRTYQEGANGAATAAPAIPAPKD